jgi:hypothetical protein
MHLLTAEQSQIVTNDAAGVMGLDYIINESTLCGHHWIGKTVPIISCILFNILAIWTIVLVYSTWKCIISSN